MEGASDETMKTKPWAMGLVFISTLMTATGQILIKMGSNTLSADLSSLVTNLPLFAGYGLYVLSAGVLVLSLKYGELSVLYPIYAMNFIWVAIASPHFFPHDVMNPLKWAGVISIVLGVAVIGLGTGGVKND